MTRKEWNYLCLTAPRKKVEKPEFKKATLANFILCFLQVKFRYEKNQLLFIELPIHLFLDLGSNVLNWPLFFPINYITLL